MHCRSRSSSALIRSAISVSGFVPAIESTLLHLVLFFCQLLQSANPIAGKEPMAVSGSCSGDEAASAPSSPKNKVKFLCSHGGKILPRPADGHLKYVGGETRVVSVPRDISFSELMKKLSALSEGDMILKYQLAAEDLDALVSVKSDEDLKHMFDEYDCHAGEGAPRLRAFLFPSVLTVVETQPAASLDPHALEQRYIDAVNGVIRRSPSLSPIRGPSKVFYSPSRATFSISSACSSPKSPSPDSNPEYPASQEAAASARSYRGNSPLQHPVHKVHSSPSLYGLGNVPHSGHGPGNASVHQQYNHHYHHHSYQHQHQNQHQFSYHHPRPLQVEPYHGTGHDRLPSPSGIGRAEIGRSPLNQGIGPYYPDTGKSHLNQGVGPYYPSYQAGRSYRANANGYNNSISDDFGVYGYRRAERADSLPQSPRTTIWEGVCYKGEQ